jgi:hypothetical protein
MSDGSQEIEQVRQARRILERMHSRLQHPSLHSWEASAADLSLAAECLDELDVSLKSPIWRGPARAAIEIEVVALRSAVRAVEKLLRNAGKFYAGLARLLAPDEAPANYTIAGASSAALQLSAGSVVAHG